MNRFLVRLAPVLIMALAMSAMPPPAHAVTHAVAAGNRFCYTWDFQNNTGQEADDLHAEFIGVQQLGDVYTGPMNPFGLPAVSSSGQSLALDFSGGPVFPADVVRLGFCTAASQLRLVDGASFRWTSGGATLQPNPLFIGVRWEWQNRRTLRVDLFNDQSAPVLLTAVNLLDAMNALTLDDLDAEVSGQLPLLAEVVGDPVIVPASGTASFVAFFDFGSVVTRVTSGAESVTSRQPLRTSGSPPMGDQPFVLAVEIAAEDDPGVTAHLFVQGLAFPARYLPIAVKQ